MKSFADVLSAVVIRCAVAHDRQLVCLRKPCESPIEEMFADAVMRRGVERGMVAAVSCVDLAALRTEGRRGLCDLLCAAQVAIGRFRSDFVFIRNGVGGESIVAVECDGHDFHEKTKEQAARDKARDRSVMAENVRVFRFTGSEIWRDADGCVDEVMAVFERENHAPLPFEMILPPFVESYPPV